MDFDQALAGAIRRARERSGQRQEDVAAQARMWGLSWTPATVAAIETGRRHVSAVELLLLPFALRTGGTRPIALPDLLADLGDVQLTPESATRGEALALLARGDSTGAQVQCRWDAPAISFPLRNPAEFEIYYKRSGLTAKEAQEAVHEGYGEAERHAGYRFGVNGFAVALAARMLWGRSLTTERDARADPHASPQARGRITRQLFDELAPIVPEAVRIIEEAEASADRARSDRSRADVEERA